MNTNIVVTAVIALVIGLGGGYMLSGATQTPVPTSTAGMHVMPDGSSMSDAMADMTASLEGKTGDEFDRAFIEGMIVHHEGAVAMAEQALQTAKHPEIKQMANDIITAQTREIETMRGWLQAWYGVSE